jgi:hypothetical protein
VWRKGERFPPGFPNAFQGPVFIADWVTEMAKAMAGFQPLQPPLNRTPFRPANRPLFRGGRTNAKLWNEMDLEEVAFPCAGSEANPVENPRQMEKGFSARAFGFESLSTNAASPGGWF